MRKSVLLAGRADKAHQLLVVDHAPRPAFRLGMNRDLRAALLPDRWTRGS